MKNKRIPLIDRFESRFEKSDKLNCWIWHGSKTNSGYGSISLEMPVGCRSPRTILAHRLSYKTYIGEIPLGMCVCHKCDTPLCVNPNHLFLGTIKENNLDRDSKGRCRASGKPGEKCAAAKLNEKQVIEILKDNRTHYKIAETHGVSRGCITNIKRGLTWRCIRTVLGAKAWEELVK